MQTTRSRLVLTCIWVGFFVAFTSITSTNWKYARVDKETLYLPISQFPSQGTATGLLPHWQVSEQPFLAGEVLDHSAGITIDSWVDQNEPGQHTLINQLVYDYSMQAQAMWAYIRYSGHPTPGTPSNTIMQSELPTDKRFADQERLLCIDGNAMTCTTWCYWARYHQYVVRFTISNDQQKLDRRNILQLIEHLDQHIQQRLQSGTN